MDNRQPTIAYFSMEIAVEPSIPSYSGGLGVLAGDTLRSAADLEVPMVALTLLHRKGYFHQTLEPSGRQHETVEDWNPAEKLRLLDPVARLVLEGRTVQIGVWSYEIRGVTGHVVPIYFLDTDLSDNDAAARTLTDYLYGGDQHYRLCQEAVLGLGGLEILDALQHETVKIYHLNEGHSALLALGLLERQVRLRDGTAIGPEDLSAVRRRCVFTTHTPVPAGHDQFEKPMAQQTLGDARMNMIEAAEGYHDGTLNMTYLALRLSQYINGVAMHHGEVSRGMFPDYPIRAITNGVHAVTWAALPFAELYDRRPLTRSAHHFPRRGIGSHISSVVPGSPRVRNFAQFWWAQWTGGHRWERGSEAVLQLAGCLQH